MLSITPCTFLGSNYVSEEIYGNAATLGRIPLFLSVLGNMPIGALVYSDLRESPAVP